MGFFEALKLRTPAMDIIVDRLTWQVHLPENRRMLRYDGDVHYRPRVSSYAMSAQERQGMQTLGAPREEAGGVQRFAITATRTAGVLPVPIRLASTTPAYHFERSIVPEGVTLNLSLSTYAALYLPYLGYLRPPIMLLAGLLLGGLLAAIKQHRSWGRLPFVFLLLFLGICVWMLLEEQVYAHQLAVWGISGLLISFLYAAARKGVTRKKQEAETQNDHVEHPETS